VKNVFESEKEKKVVFAFILVVNEADIIVLFVKIFILLILDAKNVLLRKELK